MSVRIRICTFSLLAGLMLLLVLAVTIDARVQAGLLPAPVLLEQDPAPNAVAAAVDAPVRAVYDQPMDPATLTFRTFAVHALQTGWLTRSLSVDGAALVLTPTTPFRPGELVQVSATTSTLSLGGEGAALPTVWQFWTTVAGGSAQMEDSGQQLGNNDNRGAALGDLDGDGDLDAFVGDHLGPSQVYFNDGSGHFTDSGHSPGSPDTLGIVLGDLEGDGDLDVFEARADGSPNHVWWNDGSGQFSDSGQVLGASHSYTPGLGDLDGDGDLDVFVPNGDQSFGGGGQPNRVYFNDGSGLFNDSGQLLGIEPSVVAALGDLDGDGDLDAFVANGGLFSSPNKVWFNDGTGGFTDSGQALGSRNSIFAALGDLDGDGDLDAAVTNASLTGTGAPDEIWLNDGSGHFTLWQTLGDVASAAAALGDLDGDGDFDLLVCREQSTIWLNDGSASFSLSDQPLNQCAGPLLGDLDDDGDLDAFLVNTTFAPVPNEVWFNKAAFESFLPLVLLE